MFNPFKKKENTFKLDESTIPSMSDIQNQSDSLPRIKDDPPLGEVTRDDVSSHSDNFTTFTPVPSHIPPQTAQDNSSFDRAAYHSEITKVKMDSVEAKMSLMEARLSSVDQKLDLILKILDEEVSDKTRQKLKLDSMKSYIRR